VTPTLPSTTTFSPLVTLSASPKSSVFDNEFGAQQPLGFFDPLNLVGSGDRATFDRLRYVELKHGRVCTMSHDRYGSLHDNDDDDVEYTAAAAAARKQKPSPVTSNGLMRSSGGGGSITRDTETAAQSDGLLRTPVSTDSSSNDEDDVDDDEDDLYAMTLAELLYSSSSYYAIAKPVLLTMILAAAAVCYINTDATRSQGAAAMASAYQAWHVNSSASNGMGTELALSLANALVLPSLGA
jgi:Chlorophyll A-B binding protein